MPGYEAPTARTFGRSNRGAAIRMPSYVSDPQLRRIEYRPPDLTANPYLCAAAILMAGLDGIDQPHRPGGCRVPARGRAQRQPAARRSSCPARWPTPWTPWSATTST